MGLPRILETVLSRFAALAGGSAYMGP